MKSDFVCCRKGQVLNRQRINGAGNEQETGNALSQAGVRYVTRASDQGSRYSLIPIRYGKVYKVDKVFWLKDWFLTLSNIGRNRHYPLGGLLLLTASFHLPLRHA